MEYIDLLQILGTAAMLTLAVVCGLLSYPEKNALYVAIGQIVFRWMFFLLLILCIGRIAILMGFATESARYINSISFIVAVFFITANVFRFTHKKRKKKL